MDLYTYCRMIELINLDLYLTQMSWTMLLASCTYRMLWQDLKSVIQCTIEMLLTQVKEYEIRIHTQHMRRISTYLNLIWK